MRDSGGALSEGEAGAPERAQGKINANSLGK